MSAAPDIEQAVRYADWWLNLARDLARHDRQQPRELRGRLDTAYATLHPAVRITQPADGSVHRD